MAVLFFAPFAESVLEEEQQATRIATQCSCSTTNVSEEIVSLVVCVTNLLDGIPVRLPST
jgi:hypothetical protein